MGGFRSVDDVCIQDIIRVSSTASTVALFTMCTQIYVHTICTKQDRDNTTRSCRCTVMSSFSSRSSGRRNRRAASLKFSATEPMVSRPDTVNRVSEWTTTETGQNPLEMHLYSRSYQLTTLDCQQTSKVRTTDWSVH